jgi:hypothetical protein
MLGSQLLDLLLAIADRLQRKILVPLIGIAFVLLDMLANGAALTLELA